MSHANTLETTMIETDLKNNHENQPEQLDQPDQPSQPNQPSQPEPLEQSDDYILQLEKNRLIERRSTPFYLKNLHLLTEVDDGLSCMYLNLFKYTSGMTVGEICEFKQVDRCPMNKSVIYYHNRKLFLCGDGGPATEIRVSEDADCYEIMFVFTYINWLMPKVKHPYQDEQLLDIIKHFTIPLISVNMQERIVNDLGKLEEYSEGILSIVESCLKTSADGFGTHSMFGHNTAEEWSAKKTAM